MFGTSTLQAHAIWIDLPLTHLHFILNHVYKALQKSNYD